jgi:hypothetical protein
MSYEMIRTLETEITPYQRAMRRAALVISGAATAVGLLYWFA